MCHLAQHILLFLRNTTQIVYSSQFAPNHVVKFLIVCLLEERNTTN